MFFLSKRLKNFVNSSKYITFATLNETVCVHNLLPSETKVSNNSKTNKIYKNYGKSNCC